MAVAGVARRDPETPRKREKRTRGGSPGGGVRRRPCYLYADVKQPPGPPPWRALVSTSVPFVCTSDDVSSQAPPRVVVGPRRSAAASAKPPLPTPTSTYLGLRRERARGRGEGGRRSRSRGGACAKSPGSFICICHCRPRWNGGRMPLSFSEEDSPPSGRLLLSFRVFLRVSLCSPPPPNPVLLHRRRRRRRRRHGIAENSRVPIDIRYQSYRTPTNSIFPATRVQVFLISSRTARRTVRFAVTMLL